MIRCKNSVVSIAYTARDGNVGARKLALHQIRLKALLLLYRSNGGRGCILLVTIPDVDTTGAGSESPPKFISNPPESSCDRVYNVRIRERVLMARVGSSNQDPRCFLLLMPV